MSARHRDHGAEARTTGPSAGSSRAPPEEAGAPRRARTACSRRRAASTRRCSRARGRSPARTRPRRCRSQSRPTCWPWSDHQRGRRATRSRSRRANLRTYAARSRPGRAARATVRRCRRARSRAACRRSRRARPESALAAVAMMMQLEVAQPRDWMMSAHSGVGAPRPSGARMSTIAGTRASAPIGRPQRASGSRRATRQDRERGLRAATARGRNP